MPPLRCAIKVTALSASVSKRGAGRPAAEKLPATAVAIAPWTAVSPRARAASSVRMVETANGYRPRSHEGQGTLPAALSRAAAEPAGSSATMRWMRLAVLSQRWAQ